MTPVNNKSLLHFIFDQMEKLDKNDISVDQAKAQANLAKQANNSLKYELERATTLMKIAEHKMNTGNDVEFREAEGKNFD
jgi:hypothetical protein